MIRVSKESAASIPLPPSGKAILFCDIADGHYKIKDDAEDVHVLLKVQFPAGDPTTDQQ